MSDMRLIVAGAGGRMGRTLIQAIAATDGATLAGAVDAPGSAVIGRDAGELAGLGRNGVTLPPMSSRCWPTPTASSISPSRPRPWPWPSLRRGKVHIIGTTGLSGENEKLIAEAAKRAVIVKSGNMSMGVNLLAALTKRVAKTLDEDFDIEIFEMHHNKKIDAPSGTALMLGRAAAEGRGIDLDAALGARPRRRDRRAHARRYRLCVAARRLRRRRSQRDLRRAGRAHRTLHKRRGSHDLRPRRGKAALWARGRSRALFDGDVLGSR